MKARALFANCLEGLRDRFGWDGVYEGEHIIALADPKGMANISLEPGGQFELSGAPLSPSTTPVLK